MKTASVTIYSFSELSPTAKARAIADHSAAFGFCWADEYLASLRALAEHFGGKLKDYSVNWDDSSYSSADFDMPTDGLAYLSDAEDAETEAASIAAKLAALGSYDPSTLKGHGNCKLTGFCGDESAIDGFRVAFHRDGERDLGRLMQAAFRNWLKDAQADCADQGSDEQFSETADANGWQFRENGSLHA